jgi:hypothetical protein
MTSSASDLFIVDNSDATWKVRNYLAEWCDLSKQIDIATGYFEIGAFLALGDGLTKVDKIHDLARNDVLKRIDMPDPFLERVKLLRFTNTNSPVKILRYAREIVSTTTRRCQLAAVIIHSTKFLADLLPLGEIASAITEKFPIKEKNHYSDQVYQNSKACHDRATGQN